MSPVGLVVVSHSARLAEGVVELAAQMAGSVPLVAAGGTDDGGLGTSFEKIMRGIDEADQGRGVVIMADLGSAVMTAESVLEFLEDDRRARVLLADAALVEGTVAAAVAAESGAEVDAVVRAAEEAFPGATPEEAPEVGEPTSSAVVTLPNRAGLHARPAAILAGRLSQFDAEITINGADAQSVMALMALNARKGAQLVVEASGPDADEAVRLVREQVEHGFGEPA
ncbi:dihydroxyacetone kinase phosphoryl donor subunit DhaM [Sinomonas sp. ASV322]|uniref:dihydroxyacetone kinase phosphoryl donor subunit DhaM n=1 Tax=Sinomonas sp. ASV322 TaxID=3041920 RepID=UPI0027DADE61|nr:dihydroxyacetone kinase phosphoryl donor subunit DhaM [Sinomonas sp. ASV322]MDQ4501402.1 dihydroxyacetone kinase phosphoryl donor subunit DhaM [Sinomonas sp. ASV322]